MTESSHDKYWFLADFIALIFSNALIVFGTGVISSLRDVIPADKLLVNKDFWIMGGVPVTVGLIGIINTYINYRKH